MDSDCRSNVCAHWADGFPGGYCLSWCNLDLGFCPDDAQCTSVGFPHSGFCLDGCSTDADCRVHEGYACFDFGAMVCHPT